LKGDSLRLKATLLWRMIRILSLLLAILILYRVHSFLGLFRSSVCHRDRTKQVHRKAASRICRTAIELRGIMIKLGQFLSARVDLLPEEYIQELARLQDQVPPVEFRTIRARIIEELGEAPESYFDRFQEMPIAAASLGQVHEAYLKNATDGIQRVAVKVQYPGIQDIVETDLRAAKWAARLLTARFPTIRFDVLYEEFSRILHEELNYIHEGRNAEQFYRNFSGDPKIVVPRVVWAGTTPHVLTLEFVEGIKISDLEEMTTRGVRLKEVAHLLLEAYVKQIFEHRFLHGDPHPGNLFVQILPEGALKLVFVDFGLMQRITHEMQEGMKTAAQSVIDRDRAGIVKGLLALGFIARGGDLQEVEKVVGFFMERYRDVSPRELKQITIGQIRQDLAQVFGIWSSIQLPNNFILIGRVVGMLNGLTARLDPDINIIEIATPSVREFFRGKQEGFFKELLNQGKTMGRTLASLPVSVQEFFDLANHGQFRTQMSSEDVTGVLVKIYKLIYRFMMAFMTTVLAIVWLYLDRNGPKELIWLAGLVAGGFGLTLIWTFLKDLRRW
jgi:predicted unusual protein kinase regulating ubiquinone biosynthesis (AarF/ABC1/UbiB family)